MKRQSSEYGTGMVGKLNDGFVTLRQRAPCYDLTASGSAFVPCMCSDRTYLFCRDHTSFLYWIYWLAETKIA
jgi:hypothetical protein